MMRKNPAAIWCLLLAVTAVCVSAPSAFAQTGNRTTLSGGYQSLTYVTGTSDAIWRVCINGSCHLEDGPVHATDSDHGWFADFSRNVAPRVALVAKAIGTYAANGGYFTNADSTFTRSSTHQLLGGVRVSFPGSRRFLPFAHALTGGVRASISERRGAASATGRVFETGGGFDVMVSDRMGLRFGGDYVRFSLDGFSDDTASFSTGVILGL